MKNDFLNLRVPVWITAIDFFNDDNNRVAVGSANHIVRVYDRREKRRPVYETDWHEHPVTALTLKPSNHSLLVGNSAGHMSEIDLRNGKHLGAFKGSAGSIRSIVCHKTQPYVGVCGLDRVFKLYDANRKIVKQVNLGLVVEWSLTVCKVVGSIPGRVIPKDCKSWYSLLPAKHSALKGRIEGKWCKNQG